MPKSNPGRLTTADKIIFTVIAVLAAAVVALIVFGCDAPSVDGADGGADAAVEDSGPDTDTNTDDAGPDSGGLARCPKPNDCLVEAECLELGQTVLPEFFCAAAGEVCCHVTM